MSRSGRLRTDGGAVVMERMRVRVVSAVVAVVVALLAGCSSSAEEPPGLTASPTVSATPTPEPSDDTAAVEAAILEVYYAYWDATVAAQRGNPDSELFTGNATGPLVEEEVAQARQFRDLGIVREGEPAFSSVTVDQDGDTATVLACADYTTWVVPGVEDTLPDIAPSGVQLEREVGAWFVTAHVMPPESFTC